MTRTVLESKTKTVVIGFDEPFCVIGERINPTGRKKLAAELEAGNFETVIRDALEQVAGKAVRERVRFERDERIANIVANWPSGASAARAARLGLHPHENFADIIRQYIDDCRALPNADQTLKGLS